MGTWGSGLWDNDKSLNKLGDLIRVAPSIDLTHLLVSWGLRLWFKQCEPKALARAVERRSAEVIKLPKPLFGMLSEIAQHPERFTEKHSRTAEHNALIGSSCDGFRIEPLFELPAARALAAEVAERCAANLDAMLTAPKPSLYEKPLTELGVLLELANIGLFQPAERVAKWRTGFSELTAGKSDDRPFWGEYAARVEKIFPLVTAGRSSKSLV